MKWRGWERVVVNVQDSDNPALSHEVPAIAPLIVSASRATDIPSFYGDWFMHRIKAGYVKWASPYGGRPVYVSFEKARVFAFWSKNPAPFIPCLDELDRMGYGWFFLMTLNDYVKENLEPGIPPLEERIETFKRISRRAGPGRIVWRFDPLLLSDTITVEDLLERIGNIGDAVHTCTKRLVISFIDIARYGKVRRNLAAAGFHGVREFSTEEMTALAEGLADLNRGWGLSVTACGERYDLSGFEISRGGCIGYDLLASEFSCDPALRAFLSAPRQETLPGTDTGNLHLRHLKDPGQRNACRCVVSKDIGQYSTCPHGCVYCYANSSKNLAQRNYQRYCEDALAGTFHESIIGCK